MADQHVKGAVNTIEGTVKEGVGKLTGDKGLEVQGKVQQVQGKVQGKVGDLQDHLDADHSSDQDTQREHHQD